MRNLDLNEMENLEGGGCVRDALTATFSFVAFGAAVLTTGPIGAGAGWALLGTGISSANLLLNGNCF